MKPDLSPQTPLPASLGPPKQGDIDRLQVDGVTTAFDASKSLSSAEATHLAWSMVNESSGNAFHDHTLMLIRRLVRRCDVRALSTVMTDGVLQAIKGLLADEDVKVIVKDLAFAVLPLLSDHAPLHPDEIPSTSHFARSDRPRTRSEFALAWLRSMGVTREFATEYQRGYFRQFSFTSNVAKDFQALESGLPGLLAIALNPFEVSPLNPSMPPPGEELFRAIPGDGKGTIRMTLEQHRGFVLNAIEAALVAFAPDHPPDLIDVTAHIEMFPRSKLPVGYAKTKPAQITYPQTRRPFGHALWEPSGSLINLVCCIPILERLYVKNGKNDLLISQVREGLLKAVKTLAFHEAPTALAKLWLEVVASDFGWIDAGTATKVLTSVHSQTIQDPRSGLRETKNFSFPDVLLKQRTDDQGFALSCVQSLQRAGVDVAAPFEFVQNVRVVSPIARHESLLCTAARACNSAIFGYLLGLGADPSLPGLEKNGDGQWVRSASPVELLNTISGHAGTSRNNPALQKELAALDAMQDMTRSWLSRKAASDAMRELVRPFLRSSSALDVARIKR